MDSHNSPTVSCKARSGYGLQTIKVSPAPNNSQPPIVMITPKRDEVDFIDVETPRKPSNANTSTNIYYYNDKGIGTEENTKKPFDKEKFKKYCCIGWIIFFLIIVILVIYTFILYAIGVAFLKSHYKISIDGNVLHLNSLDVERYYSNYIDPTQQQQSGSSSRILQSINNLKNIKEEKEKNTNIKPKLVKSSSNNNRNRLIIDNNKELHLKTKSVESENAYIDGKTEFFGNVKFGNSTKPVNVEVDNGGFKVKSLTVTDTIDLGKSKFVWDAEDQFNGEEYRNVKLGSLSIRTLNIESKICSVDASSITKINGVKFTSSETISSDNDLTIKPGVKDMDKVIIKGETMMDSINLGTIANGGRVYVGLTDKSFPDDDPQSSIMKLYINGEKQSVIDTYKIIAQSTISAGAIYTDNIGVENIDQQPIKLLSPLYGDQQTITVTNAVFDNMKLTNIECRNNVGVDGRCTGKISINEIINMNDYDIQNVGTLQVNAIKSKNSKINLLNDLNLGNKNIESVSVVNVNRIKASEGSTITFDSNIDTGTNGIKAETIILTDSISTPKIVTTSQSITIGNSLNLGINNIDTSGEIKTGTLSAANSILTKTIGGLTPAGTIAINNDLNLGGRSISANAIMLNSLKTNTIEAETGNGVITVNNNLRLSTNSIDSGGTITANEITGTTKITTKELEATTSISTPKITASGEVKAATLSVGSAATVGTLSVTNTITAKEITGTTKIITAELEASGEIKAGTLSVTNTMKVTGLLKIPSVTSSPTCTADNDGSLFYDSTSNKLYVCNGSNLKKVQLS